MNNPLPNSGYEPLLVIRGKGNEELGLGINNGFVVALHRVGAERWIPLIQMPPKLLAYIDTFMAQHFNLLNNRYGIEDGA